MKLIGVTIKWMYAVIIFIPENIITRIYPLLIRYTNDEFWVDICLGYIGIVIVRSKD